MAKKKSPAKTETSTWRKDSRSAREKLIAMGFTPTWVESIKIEIPRHYWSLGLPPEQLKTKAYQDFLGAVGSNGKYVRLFTEYGHLVEALKLQKKAFDQAAKDGLTFYVRVTLDCPAISETPIASFMAGVVNPIPTKATVTVIRETKPAKAKR